MYKYIQGTLVKPTNPSHFFPVSAQTKRRGKSSSANILITKKGDLAYVVK